MGVPIPSLASGKIGKAAAKKKDPPAKSKQHTTRKKRSEGDAANRPTAGRVLRAAMRLVAGYGREDAGYGGV